MKNKRGDFTGLLYLVVMIAATAFFLLLAGFISVEISTAMDDKIGVLNNESSEMFDATTNTARNSLTAVWFIVFGGLLLGLFITAWNIPTKPIYVPVFIILLTQSFNKRPERRYPCGPCIDGFSDTFAQYAAFCASVASRENAPAALRGLLVIIL